MFEQVNLDFDSVASGYCVSAGGLVRKWASHTGQVLGETLVQIDVPESLRALILNTAHASMGHVGREKLYDRRSKRRKFQAGDSVLSLLPVVGSLFHPKFGGPYQVLKKVSDENYCFSSRIT